MDQLFFLTPFFASLYQSHDSLGSEHHFLLLHLFLFCNSPLDVLQGYHSSFFSGPWTPWQAYLLASPVSITASAINFSKPNLDRSLSQLRTFHVHCCFQLGSTHFRKSVDSFITQSQQILWPSSPTMELLCL